MLILRAAEEVDQCAQNGIRGLSAAPLFREALIGLFNLTRYSRCQCVEYGLRSGGRGLRDRLTISGRARSALDREPAAWRGRPAAGRQTPCPIIVATRKLKLEETTRRRWSSASQAPCQPADIAVADFCVRMPPFVQLPYGDPLGSPPWETGKDRSKLKKPRGVP
jgi:hypothetical protein